VLQKTSTCTEGESEKKMLGEEHLKATIVPEEFIVPENIAEEEESDCFDSEDELSFE
jgi:hypothetical protein